MNTHPCPELDLLGMSESERIALPPIYHRPYFNGLATPHSWCCEVCWGEDFMTAWPCGAAVRGGLELAKAMGARWSW